MQNKNKLTLFSLPKAFKGQFKTIQRNAIKSWTLLNPRPDIILLGNDEGTKEIAEEFNLKHIPNIECNEHGTPLISSIFEQAKANAQTEILAYINADIILLDDFSKGLDVLYSEVKRLNIKSFLLSSQRLGVDIDFEIPFDKKDWQEELIQFLNKNASLENKWAIEMFLFTKDLYNKIPPFAIGRTSWDNWLVWSAKNSGAEVIDATEFFKLTHQNHDYSHIAQGCKNVWTGKESQKNFILANLNLLNLEDACSFSLTNDGLVQGIFADLSSNENEKESRIFKAINLFKKGDYFKALDYLEYVSVRFYNNSYKIDSLYKTFNILRTLCLIKLKRYEEAEFLLIKELKSYPKNIYLKKLFSNLKNLVNKTDFENTEIKKTCYCGGELKNSLHSSYGICTECQTLVLKEEITETEIKNRLLDEYENDSFLEKMQFQFHKSVIERINYFINENVKNKNKLLEIGSNYGIFLDSCVKNDIKEVFGVELSKKQCDYAKEKFNLKNIINAYYPNISLPYEKFDIIAGFNIIESSINPLELLKNINHSLTDDGVVFLSFDLYKGNSESWTGFEYKSNLFLFNESSVYKIFDKAGFEIINIHNVFFREFFGGFLVIAKKKLEVKNITIINTDSIISNIFLTSILPYIKTKFENSNITMICNESSKDVYKFNPHISNLINIDESKFKNRTYMENILQEFSKLPTDILINASLSREITADIITASINSKEKICIDSIISAENELKQKFDRFYTKIIQNTESFSCEIEQYRELLNKLNIDVSDIKPEIYFNEKNELFAQEIFTLNNLNSNTIAIYLDSNFENINLALSEICHKNNFNLIALGNIENFENTQNLLDKINVPSINLCGKVSINDILPILKRCKAGFGTENLVSQIAGIANIQNLLLLGGGEFGKYLNYSPKTQIICLPLECYGCKWNCKYETKYCLEKISSELITNTFTQLIESKENEFSIFVQTELDKTKDNIPKWNDFSRFIDIDTVNIIPMGKNTDNLFNSELNILKNEIYKSLN